MSARIDREENETVLKLFAEFNETIRTTGEADYSILDRCPAPHRQELRSLMNVALLAYRAFAPEREELERRELECLVS